MIVNVHMTDGRTVFQFVSRGDLHKLLGHGPVEEDARSAEAFVRWHPEQPWFPIRVQYMKKHSIAFVVNARDAADSNALEGELPAERIANERQERFEQRNRVLGTDGEAAA